MKNKKILNLSKEIPKEIRLKVYKEAIFCIENDRRVANMGSFGLCLVLPCLLWGLTLNTKLSPDGNIWNYGDTSKAFPELTQKLIGELNHLFGEKDKNVLRLKSLKKFVKNLKNDALR